MPKSESRKREPGGSYDIQPHEKVKFASCKVCSRRYAKGNYYGHVTTSRTHIKAVRS